MLKIIKLDLKKILLYQKNNIYLIQLVEFIMNVIIEICI